MIKVEPIVCIPGDVIDHLHLRRETDLLDKVGDHEILSDLDLRRDALDELLCRGRIDASKRAYADVGCDADVAPSGKRVRDVDRDILHLLGL